MKLKIGYKVVSSWDNKLFSAVVNDEKHLNVEYKVGELVKPQLEGTRLMAFETLEQARGFTGPWTSLLIYEAILLNPEPLTTVMELFELYRNHVIDFWKGNQIASNGGRNWLIETRGAPGGTLACEQIQLVRLIKKTI